MRCPSLILPCLLLAACSTPAPAPENSTTVNSAVAPDAGVIVIGAGIAGISAALEARSAGASVLVVDMNSVGGGHAVMAGGLFLVGTPLQAARGVEDSPELAYADIMRWGEDADPFWVRRYVEQSRPAVHDWLAGFGVEFSLLLPAPGETSVPRFHFARGAAVNVVVPLLRAAVADPGISLRWHSEVTGLRAAADGYRVTVRDTRTGGLSELRAPAVVVATGGFENDLAQVRSHWPPGVREPDRLLAGAGHYARGSGLVLATMAGAELTRLDHQTIFVTGFPDPRDPAGVHGLLAQNPAAIFVDADGKRFVNEEASRKVLETTVLAMPGQGYWMIFDRAGLRRLQVRGAPWLTPATLEAEILTNPALVQSADTLAELAGRAGLPAAALQATVARFNALVATGADEDFNRFGPASPRSLPKAVNQPPFYAFRLYPMTRKSMGGIAVDRSTQVLDADGRPLPGLFAAGEATGVAGINGRHGGSGTFLGPSVLTGRLAGRGAAGQPDSPLAPARPAASAADAVSAASPESTSDAASVPDRGSAGAGLLDANALTALLANPRPGYWHFEAAHRLVLEQQRSCTDCHGAGWPTRPAVTREEQRVQLESCTRCH